MNFNNDLNFAMDNSLSDQLVGSEIHGFHTLQELDVASMREEAKTRWLRPNEILAILCNYKYFGVRVKPVRLPESGTIVLFDRKMLRNFRKDGHNWKKKNDGKTVKEAHEHLKVGSEERIHVYYAHGQDHATFTRRCYWLLDKSLEHIVLVHYRETKEGSPSTPVNSNSCSVSDLSPPWVATEELDSRVVNAHGGASTEPLEGTESLSLRHHEKRLYEINTLDWDELLGTDLINESILPIAAKDFVSNQQNHLTVNGSQGIADPLAACTLSTELTALGCSSEQTALAITALAITAQDNRLEGFSNPVLYGQLDSTMESQDVSAARADESPANAVNDGLENIGDPGMWFHPIMDTLESVHDPRLVPAISSVQDFPQSQSVDNQQSQVPEHIFEITAVSPLWAYATEETKILITGLFCQDCQHLAKSNLLCVCGDVSVPAEAVQPGVYKCSVPQHSPGFVNLYMSIEGRKPISQVLNFEYCTPLSYEPIAPAEDQYKWEEFEIQMRLARLLFSTSKGLQVLYTKVSPNALKEAKIFARKTTSILNSWAYLMKLIESGRASFTEARERLFEVTLKNRLREWLLEKKIEGCKTTEYDKNGQGIIHLCAILGYTWAVDLFSWSDFSLDFRDKHGWTALHWAAYCGQQKMVAVLLTAGAKPNLVTDPTRENPGGCTAADLASVTGFDGLAAYLSEMALVSQFKDMILAGNARGSLMTNTEDSIKTENLSEDQLYMKDSLAAYKRAAEASGLIHSAMRERAFRLRSGALRFSNPEDEARHIVAAMKIQHAFRKYDVKKKMAAADRIQSRYRTWKLRREFINMRRQAIKIQAAFRAFRTRKQYHKIVWSVGIIEKAILRWRLKRQGFRGLQVKQEEAMENEREQSDTEEEFFKISQKQAEERVERAVVTVQSMFRSKKAQEEYRRMKLTHNQALLEHEGFLNPYINSDT